MSASPGRVGESSQELLGTEEQTRLLDVLQSTVDAVMVEVGRASPLYADVFTSTRGDELRSRIEVALRTFIRLASAKQNPEYDEAAVIGPALEASFALGRTEATGGRGMEELLTAFRIGARTTWRHFAAATSAQMNPTAVAGVAELLFDFIDQLSASAAAGHQEQTALSFQVRDQERTALAHELLAGHTPGTERVQRADWIVPSTITVAVAHAADKARLRSTLPRNTLLVTVENDARVELTAVALIPDLTDTDRKRLLADPGGTARLVLGPTVVKERAEQSHRWARSIWSNDRIKPSSSGGGIDSDDHLIEVVLASDRSAIEALRTKLLGPLDDLAPPARARLEQTLLAYFEFQGRHDQIAQSLHIHPQTVRYRLGQLRALLGDQFGDPRLVLAVHVSVRAGEPW